MRRTFVAALLVPVSLAAQAAPAVEAWQKADGPSLAKYETDRGKWRAKTEKARLNVDRAEDNWLSVGRDALGRTEATVTGSGFHRMDPEYINTLRVRRHEQLASDDSSAAAVIAARRGGDPKAAFTVLSERRGIVGALATEIDSLIRQAKINLRDAQEDEIKNKQVINRPLNSPQDNAYLKVLLDYEARLIKALRARIDYHQDQVEALRSELKYVDEQIAAAKAASSS